MTKTQNEGKRDHWLFLIGAAKCLKGLLLLGLAVGAVNVLHRDAGSVLKHWIEWIHVDPNNQYFASLIQKVGALQAHKKLLLATGTFLYSGLFLTEGTGLLLQQHWAEYFAVVITGSFLPLEVYELTKHVSAAKIVVIVLNTAIVLYLVWKLKHQRPKRVSCRG